MNNTQQTDVLSQLIEQFIEHSISSPQAPQLLEQWKAFPLVRSPQFFRIIHVACEKGNLELVKYMEANYKHTLDLPNVRGETPLFIATKYNHLLVAKFLIDSGVNIAATTSCGDTYLHWIVCAPPSAMKNEIIDKILTTCTALLTSKNVIKETPLHIAALIGDLPVVKKLVECGADATEKTSRAIDVFEYSLMSGNIEVIKFIRNLTGRDEEEEEEEEKPEKQASPTAEKATGEVRSSGRAKTFRGRRIAAAQSARAAASAVQQMSFDSPSGSAEDSANNEMMKSYFGFETTVKGLYEKFQSFTVEDKKWKKKISKKGKMSEEDFRLHTIMLMKEHFVSKRMFETQNNWGKDKKYRIISLDGGGIKVFMSILILQRLSAEFPTLFEKTNLFCGCSASSFVVSLLTMGVSIEGVRELMTNLYANGFKKDPLAVGSVTKAKYTNEYLRIFTESCFGTMEIKNMPRHMCIPGLMIDSLDKTDDNGNRYHKAQAFNNIVHENEHELIADICVRSASAPTFFRPYQGYVDGGLICNNPCGCVWPYLIGEKGLGIDRKNIVCLSISAGLPIGKYIDVDKLGGGGLAQWATNIADAYGMARRDASVREAKLLLGDKYLRVDPPIPNGIILDDIDEVEKIKKIAESYDLEEIRKWLRENWD